MIQVAGLSQLENVRIEVLLVEPVLLHDDAEGAVTEAGANQRQIAIFIIRQVFRFTAVTDYSIDGSIG